MPVTFDNSFATASSGTASQFTFTVGANAVLLAFITNDGVAQSVSAVAYGGVAMTQHIHRLVQPGAAAVPYDIWVLTAPAAGANVLSCQFKTSDNWYVIATSYLNVKSIGGFGTPQGTTATSGTTNSFSLSSTTTDLCVFGYNCGLALTGMVGATERGSLGAGSVKVWEVAGGGPTKSISVSAATSTFFIGAGLSLQFSAAAASTLRFFRNLTGVGY